MSTRSRQSVVCYVGGHAGPPLHKPHQRKVQPSDAVAPVFVGADLCVRPFSSERYMLCGRTLKSAPTQTTSKQKFQPSDAVAPVFVETHESDESEGVRCVEGYSIVALTGTDAIPLDTSERPYKGLPVLR